eukprot:gene21097-21876_t
MRPHQFFCRRAETIPPRPRNSVDNLAIRRPNSGLIVAVVTMQTNDGKRLERKTRKTSKRLAIALACNLGIAAAYGLVSVIPASASSHMDAPLVTLEPAANTTDVYAFVSQPANGPQTLTTALAVYPFEQPGIGPNLFKFDDNVVYDIHVALDGDIAKGKADLTYRFTFNTQYKNSNTI